MKDIKFHKLVQIKIGLSISVRYVLTIDAAGGYKWDNLSDTQQAKMNSVSGVKLEKETLVAGMRNYEEDTDDRIFTLKLALESDAQQISFEVVPEAGVCHSEQGWCREFEVPFRVTDNLLTP